MEINIISPTYKDSQQLIAKHLLKPKLSYSDIAIARIARFIYKVLIKALSQRRPWYMIDTAGVKLMQGVQWNNNVVSL